MDSDDLKKTKRQMKSQHQLETLEQAYASEMYPSDAMRGELSRRLGLTDKQLRMWFCHRRSKERKEGQNWVRVVARVQAQLGHEVREDGPILGVEFDVLPPGAFGRPINEDDDDEDDAMMMKKSRDFQALERRMKKEDELRRKEEMRLMREQQRMEERLRREMERKERLLQKELLRAEMKRQKEKAAMERAAAAQKIAVGSIEDERLELMELAAASRGLPSILLLDYEALQELEFFRDSLCEFPPESVKMKKPFGVDSEENVGNLVMVWKFCTTFADHLGLRSFTIDKFIEALHDSDSRLLGKIHIALLKMIIKDVVRTPAAGPGANQYSVFSHEGGHPQIVEGAKACGFDIHSWQKQLNPLSWPEISRQIAVSAGFGPELKKKDNKNENGDDDSKGCEDIVASLRDGSAAKSAANTMRSKEQHRLTPGTVRFAAYHVLALEGSKGLNVVDLAEKIQKSGLRDSSATSKTISVALSRDPRLFEKIAPSTYNVRPAYRKNPADAEAILEEAREKVQRSVNGVLTAEDVEVDNIAEESGSESGENGAFSAEDDEVDDGNDNITADIPAEKKETSVQEYSELSVEERINALVLLIGIANEGNSVRAILAALKKARAEERHAYRSAPLGSDRRGNRYWLFGRIFVESPDGHWRLIDTEDAFDALITALDKRGVRESHLQKMLQKIDGPFRDGIRRNFMPCEEREPEIQEEKKVEFVNHKRKMRTVVSRNHKGWGVNSDSKRPKMVTKDNSSSGSDDCKNSPRATFNLTRSDRMGTSEDEEEQSEDEEQMQVDGSDDESDRNVEEVEEDDEQEDGEDDGAEEEVSDSEVSEDFSDSCL